MNYSTKPQHLNFKAKNRNIQMMPPNSAGVHYLSAPNISNTGQLQTSRKYINNMSNVNEVSVLQYHRTTNMQTKNNNLEINHFQNLRHQQQQAFVYKAPQYYNYLNPNLPQKLPISHPMQRKMFKEPTIPVDVLQQSNKNVGFNSKKSKELQKNQEVHKLSNTNKIMPLKLRKFHTKTAISEEKSKLSNEETENIAVVPENVCVEEKRVEGTIEVNNNTEEQKDVEQVQISNSELSTADNNEEINIHSTKDVREKTPMCLINDLARFNKISFQYRLTGENGPAHCKRFTVTLKLGDEEYTAEGFKIKKAQHLAAKEAIENTKYKHPTPKINRRADDISKSNITPTVELNALAMKLGQQTYYIFDPRQMENNYNYRLNCQSIETNKATTQQLSAAMVENLKNNGKQILNQKRHYLPKLQNRYGPFQHSLQNSSNPAVCTYFPPTAPCKITLIVGTRQFIGVGRTLQQAKHDAASNALQVLKEQMRNEQIEPHNEKTEDKENKSPISQVFEIGIKRNLPVDFKVLREEGPAHMRTFITACIVGDIVTEGEGTGKKLSKKKAAQNMLEELKKLPPLTPVDPPVKRVKLKTSKKNYGESKGSPLVESKDNKEKSCNKKASKDLEADSPITKLLEWHQNKKEKEPVFRLVSEFGKENSRKKHFVMEVSSNRMMARGVGNSKKMAKRDAAQNFLTAVKEIEQHSETETEKDNTIKVSNNTEENKNLTETSNKSLAKEITKKLPHKEPWSQLENMDKVTINTSSNASTNSEIVKESAVITSASSKSQTLHMKDQLMYLAKLLGFDVEFSNYPKGNHSEFLTIVMLSTNPPQICHGVGINAKESQEDAAKNALKILSEMGLNNAVNA